MTAAKIPDPVSRLEKSKFEKLFHQFFPPLMSLARKFLRDEDDAREVVHQVFINLWDRWSDIDTGVSLKSYLFTSVHNRSLNVIRDRKKFSAEEVPDISGDVDVSAQIEAIELEERIRESIASLPEKCRQIFEMNRFEGLKYREIAEKLQISVKTVENQMSKALKILRERLIIYLAMGLWLILFALN